MGLFWEGGDPLAAIASIDRDDEGWKNRRDRQGGGAESAKGAKTGRLRGLFRVLFRWLFLGLSLFVAVIAVAHWCDIPPHISVAPGAGGWWSRIHFVDRPKDWQLDFHNALLLGLACSLPF